MLGLRRGGFMRHPRKINRAPRRQSKGTIESENPFPASKVWNFYFFLAVFAEKQQNSRVFSCFSARTASPHPNFRLLRSQTGSLAFYCPQASSVWSTSRTLCCSLRETPEKRRISAIFERFGGSTLCTSTLSAARGLWVVQNWPGNPFLVRN